SSGAVSRMVSWRNKRLTLGHTRARKEAAHSADPMRKNESKTEVTMSRLTPIQTNGATAELKRSLRSSHLKLGKAPNFLQIMAHSPASLRAYICADAALVRGQLTPRQREQVALAVAEINGCAYSLSAHY